MLALYNALQLIGLILFFPVLFVKAILTPKYRGRALRRLGLGLGAKRQLFAAARGRGRKIIWLHALSVGEVSSARPLLTGLRKRMPDLFLLITTTTRSGEEFAARSLGATVDLILPLPFDVLPVVNRFQTAIRPDLFILVETDFWPNLLAGFRRRRIPTMLVNGRISDRSFARYQRSRFLFQALFGGFRLLAVQTALDARKLKDLGALPDRVEALGNLKYAAATSTPGADAGVAELLALRATVQKILVWVAGSTHAGEEEQILPVFSKLREKFPGLRLVLAPRQPDRAGELAQLCRDLHLGAQRRSLVELDCAFARPVFLLDTMGELSLWYGIADVAFVGGSLVPEGGHNPLEPAAFGVPVLFGPHMEDFAEIAGELLEARGAARVVDGEELEARLDPLLGAESGRRSMGDAASRVAGGYRQAVDLHLDHIRRLLQEEE